jgi:ribonuclease P protein subunit POP4
MNVDADVIRQEFVGTKTTVSESPNQGYLSIKGQVLDETRNTFLINQKGEAKTVVKDQAFFQFQFADGTIVEIDGKLLVGKSEDRIKKTIKRLW